MLIGSLHANVKREQLTNSSKYYMIRLKCVTGKIKGCLKKIHH